MSVQSNASYFFIPFQLQEPLDFLETVRRLDRSDCWTPVGERILYFMKYVSDKLDTGDPEHCQCFRFCLNPEARGRFGLSEPDSVYHIEPLRHVAEQETYPFYLGDVELFCFRTSVCILAIQVSFLKNDPIHISSGQFYLKKVAKEKVYPQNGTGSFTFLELARRLMDTLGEKVPPVPFFFANPGSERANVFSRLEVPPQEDYDRELFYLRRCYSEGYLYQPDPELDAREIYRPAQDTVWGMSAEAAVCLVCPERGKEQFLRGAFYRNFKSQYLLMYVLLLHQKYVLYLFLTEVGTGIRDDLALLESYRERLYDFMTDFVFSRISEVPQYQNLYDRLQHVFALEELFDDVREPLAALRNLQLEQDAKKQQRQDARINRMLFVLSLLTGFSVLSDGHAAIESYASPYLPPLLVEGLQYGFAALVIGALAWGIITLIRSDRK